MVMGRARLGNALSGKPADVEERIATAIHGKSRLSAQQISPENRARNRLVELTLIGQ
jgi:outer membrane protein OmpA-like peptidoglycan-associated protein